MWYFTLRVWCRGLEIYWPVTKYVSPHWFVSRMIMQRWFVCLTTSSTPLLLSTLLSFIKCKQLFHMLRTHYNCLLCCFSSVFHHFMLAKCLAQWTSSSHIYLKVHGFWWNNCWSQRQGKKPHRCKISLVEVLENMNLWENVHGIQML